MENAFGAFIRQKRLDRMIKMNAFAAQIGISNVYLSYIESGKRPAPSKPILQRMEQMLNMNNDEAAMLYSLALLSHSKRDFPPDLLEYISDRPYIARTLRVAMENNADENDWFVFQKMLRLKTDDHFQNSMYKDIVKQ